MAVSALPRPVRRPPGPDPVRAREACRRFHARASPDRVRRGATGAAVRLLPLGWHQGDGRGLVSGADGCAGAGRDRGWWASRRFAARRGQRGHAGDPQRRRRCLGGAGPRDRAHRAHRAARDAHRHEAVALVRRGGDPVVPASVARLRLSLRAGVVHGHARVSPGESLRAAEPPAGVRDLARRGFSPSPGRGARDLSARGGLSADAGVRRRPALGAPLARARAPDVSGGRGRRSARGRSAGFAVVQRQGPGHRGAGLPARCFRGDLAPPIPGRPRGGRGPGRRPPRRGGVVERPWLPRGQPRSKGEAAGARGRRAEGGHRGTHAHHRVRAVRGAPFPACRGPRRRLGAAAPNR